jgi:hypothetical protein
LATEDGEGAGFDGGRRVGEAEGGAGEVVVAEEEDLADGFDGAGGGFEGCFAAIVGANHALDGEGSDLVGGGIGREFDSGADPAGAGNEIFGATGRGAGPEVGIAPAGEDLNGAAGEVQFEFDDEVIAGVGDGFGVWGAGGAELFLAKEFPGGDGVGERELVHDEFAGAVGEVGFDGGGLEADERVAAGGFDHIVVGDRLEDGVEGLAAAVVGDILVAAGLDEGPDWGAIGVEPDAVDVLDVGGAPPAGHEGAGGGATILIGEDDGVFEDALIAVDGAGGVGKERDIGEAGKGIGAGVEDGGVGEQMIVGVGGGDFADAGVVDFEAGVFGGEFGIAGEAEGVRTGGEAAEEDGVGVAAWTAVDNDVLGGESGNGETDEGGLGAGAGPICARGGEVEVGNEFGAGVGDGEGEVADLGEGGSEGAEEEEEGEGEAADGGEEEFGADGFAEKCAGEETFGSGFEVLWHAGENDHGDAGGEALAVAEKSAAGGGVGEAEVHQDAVGGMGGKRGECLVRGGSGGDGVIGAFQQTATKVELKGVVVNEEEMGHDLLDELDAGNGEIGESLIPTFRNGIESEAESARVGRIEGCATRTDELYAFAEEALAVGVGEDAIHLDETDGAIAVVGNAARDFDEGGLHEAVGGFHLDFGELELGHVGFGLGGKGSEVFAIAGAEEEEGDGSADEEKGEGGGEKEGDVEAGFFFGGRFRSHW